MASTFTNLTYHIVFGTRYRKPTITTEFDTKLHNYIAGIINRNKGKALKINGTNDHVHILCGLSPTVCVSDAVRLIKANSSK
jgi:REP element-mobilizing transposase RayT